ncbi:hypothetical protein U1Q18_014897 [Sarracenia purpurea var. burkii]
MVHCSASEADSLVIEYYSTWVAWSVFIDYVTAAMGRQIGRRKRRHACDRVDDGTLCFSSAAYNDVRPNIDTTDSAI